MKPITKAEQSLYDLGKQEAGLKAIQVHYRGMRNDVIRKAHEDGVPVQTISRILGMSRQAVYMIINEERG